MNYWLLKDKVREELELPLPLRQVVGSLSLIADYVPPAGDMF